MINSVFHHLFAVREWFILHLLLVYVFIASGIVINCIQLLTFLTIRPLSLSVYRRVNIWLAWFHWSRKYSFSCNRQLAVFSCSKVMTVLLIIKLMLYIWTKWIESVAVFAFA